MKFHTAMNGPQTLSHYIRRTLCLAAAAFCWLLLLLVHPAAKANTFTAGQTTFPATAVSSPATASAPVVITLTAQASGTASAPLALTEGVSDPTVAEFTITDPGTCGSSPTLSQGQTCSVTVTFSPRFPGIRHGAIQLKTTGNQLLATTLISGKGQGSLPVLIPGQIDTVAGNGDRYYLGDGGPATQSPICLPSGLAVDGAGNLYLADTINNRVRRVDASSHTITTVAGNGSAGSSGDGGPATAASVTNPSGLALDGAGNLYIADTANNTIRRVDAVSGIITTVAGTPGVSGFAGDGGPATSAMLKAPQGIGVSNNGDLVIADTSNAVIRVVTVSDGLIQTIAGTGTAGYNGDGILATSAELNDPSGVALRSDGAIAIADLSNNRVRLFVAGGNISTVAGNGTAGYTGDDGNATQAELQGPAAVSFDPAGDLFIADTTNSVVRLVYGNPGIITTLAGTPGDTRFAGDGGPENQARMYLPDGLVFDSAGNLWISDTFHNRVRKVSGTQLTINFEPIKVGRTSQPPVPEQMINAGNQPLISLSPALQQAALDANTTTCGQTALSPSTFCAMGVEFAPTMVTDNGQGSITWTSNAPNVTPVDQLRGKVLSVEYTTIAITSDVNPGLIGQPVTLTATVTSADTGRTGTVDFVENSTTWCSAVPLAASGTATCQINGLSLGTHNFTANYSGDNNNAASQSPAYQEVIKQQATLALSISGNPSTVTNSVTLTLHAGDSTGTPTGTAVFYDGSTALKTVTLDGNGDASWSTAGFAIGTHTLTAQYAGDSANAAGVSNTQTLEVKQADTTTVLSSSNNESPVGSNITLTANVVSHNGPAPTGAVRFQDGSSVLGTGQVDANGSATLVTNTLSPGNHSLSATYLGDTDNAVSTSANANQTIDQIGTVTTLGVDVDPSNAGATVHFSATVSMSAGSTADGPITGIVTFLDGSKTLGSTAINASGQATLAVDNLSVGPHPVTAHFGGNPNYAASNSAVLTETVQQTATVSALSSSASTTLKGKPATFSVTVSSATGSPSGSVAFRDGANVLGSEALNASGQASFSTAVLSAGSHSIIATYSGDANYVASTSAPLQQTVVLAQPSLLLAGPSGAVDAGLNVDFSATLSSNGVTPSGTLTLQEGSAVIGSQTITAAGSYLFHTTQLAVGTHMLTAAYSGDANNAAVVSSAITVTVQQAKTVTTLTSSANPLTQGQALTLSARVQSDGPDLQGQIRFFDGSQLLGTATLDGTGLATLSPSGLALGRHQLTAVYSGDANHMDSTSPVLPELVVQSAALTLSSSVNPSVSGQNVIFTGRVAGNPVPAGSLRFSDNNTLLATVPLGADGSASFATSTLNVGTHTIAVAYSGDDHFSTAEAQLRQVVLNATTAVTLSADSNPAVYGQPLHLLVSVSSNGGTATGVTNLTEAGNVIGSVKLDASGKASFTTSTLAPGEHTIIAVYTGDGKANPSASAPLTMSVKQRTALQVASGLNPAPTLSTVKLTATLANAGAGAATGSIVFSDGALTLGSAPLDASGHATLSIPQMVAGAHDITASYAGDNKNFSAASVAFHQVVAVRPTSTTVTGTSSDPSNPQQVTLIAVVHGAGSVPPGGMVTFTSGVITLGAAAVDDTGVAAITVLFNKNPQQVVGAYTGDASYAASQSKPTPITAGSPAQFTVSLNATDITLVSHQRATITVTVASVKGFTDNIALGCLGLPYAATCTFDHSQLKLNADGQVTTSLVVDTGDPLGAGTSVSAIQRPRNTFLCFCPAGLLLLCLMRKGRRKGLPALLVLLLTLVAAGGITGCGGLQMSGTPPGTYSFRVIGTAQGSNTTESQAINLVVTQ